VGWWICCDHEALVGGFMPWRIEQAAIAHLLMMSDRELKDIGLTCSEVTNAEGQAGTVAASVSRNRGFSRPAISQ
jgi:uncharacterized protein YjiS (DUF1127 family)